MIFMIITVALFCLCLSMTRHQRDLIGQLLSRWPSFSLRMVAACLLLLSSMAAASRGADGIVGWLGELSVALIVVIAVASVASVLRLGRKSRN